MLAPILVTLVAISVSLEVIFVYKFGASFEEKRIEELERKLNKLIKEE